MESDSLVGTKWTNAPRGTGCATVGLLLEELEDPPPPPDEVLAARVVPLAEVFWLEDVPVELLALASRLPVPVEADWVESGLVEFTLAVEVEVLWLEVESAEVPEAAVPRPLVAEAVSVDVLAPPDPEPAPAEEPAVAEAVAPTVPAVDPWM
jgi:hypothetical protein